MSDIMHIGISAIKAYETALNIASQNIANADTPFYSRRAVDLIESPYLSGVNVADVRRLFDDTANRYVQQTNSDLSNWGVSKQQLRNIEPLFDDDKTNINKYIQDSYIALHQIETNFNSSNRLLFIDKLSALVKKFNDMDSELNRQVSNVNSSLETQTENVNTLLANIAGVNKQVMAATGHVAPELLDQRESLLQQLSTYIDFKRNEDQNGAITLVLNNGFPLLTGEQFVTLNSVADPANPTNTLIYARNDVTNYNITNLINGGEIAGWLNYRQSMTDAQVALGRLALVISDSMNVQNRLGIDANGNLGTDMFTNVNSTELINSRTISHGNNTGAGTMTVNIDDVHQLQPSNYQLTVGAASSYRLVRISDNTLVSSGTITGTFPQSISVDGFSLNLTGGSYNTGDRYIVAPTNGASSNMSLMISDPSQLALGWPVTSGVGIKHPGSDGSIKVTSITDTTNSSFSTPKQLTPPIEVRFTVSAGTTQYTLYNATTNAVIEGPINYTDGADIFPTPASYDPGYRVSISGKNIQDGDTFNIQYNDNGMTDNRNALAMAQVYQSGTVLTGNGQLVSFSTGFNVLSSNISVQANDATNRYETLQEVYSKAQERRSSVSGVQLEEETLSLAQFQAAYQASAQVLQTAKSVFEIISSVTRG